MNNCCTKTVSMNPLILQNCMNNDIIVAMNRSFDQFGKGFMDR